MNLSEKLADYIYQTQYENLPKEVVEFTKLCILDYFGSAIAGSTKEPIKKMEALVNEMGGSPQASLITGGKSSVMQAALLNGASSHMVEQDDIHKASIIHAATVVIPAALAVSEWKKLTGKELITAVIVGYEVCYRIGEAVTPSHYYYWHNTATCGTFGAAAAVAKLLNLNKEQIVHALGSAGTQAAGLWEFIEDGAMSKQLHPGKAAMNGVISALLAEKDFTAATKILEGKRGFFEAMSETYDISKVTEGLGATYKIMENSFKVHASCRHTHHAMDLMIEVSKKADISTSDIEEIAVKTYQVAIDITDNDNPQTEYAAKFSLQYCTALAFVKGEGGLHAFNEDNLWSQEIRDLLKRVKVEVADDIQEAYPEKWGAKVEIRLKNDEIIAVETDFPKGDPENPVTKADLLDKFHRLASPWSEMDRDSLAGKIMELESQSNLNELFARTEAITTGNHS
ncbi:MmgE/PrpD family protein [Oceanobacillus saliphilus]|uniref:MmgE/PrpD family protein n=1 Tax=Oceanobacillus saliphilus TaxID=2925834 RepID=UPI00201D3068|nr:MmgE/PrpD family protein [Oceanobacillus saliphilus]